MKLKKEIAQTMVPAQAVNVETWLAGLQDLHGEKGYCARMLKHVLCEEPPEGEPEPL